MRTGFGALPLVQWLYEPQQFAACLGGGAGSIAQKLRLPSRRRITGLTSTDRRDAWRRCSFVYGRVTSHCLENIWYARKNISRRCSDAADAAVTNGFYGSTSTSNYCPDERTLLPIQLVGQLQSLVGFVASGVAAVLPKTYSLRVTEERLLPRMASCRRTYAHTAMLENPSGKFADTAHQRSRAS